MFSGIVCATNARMRTKLRKADQERALPDSNFDLCRLSRAKAIVDVSPNTIRAYAKDGLNIYRRGKAAFFSKTELAAFIRKAGAN